MELMFESRLEIARWRGKIRFTQVEPEVHEEPVLEPDDSMPDGGGAELFGTVLHDAGIWRMWYQAWPKAWDGANPSRVGYAESADGIEWRKPSLGLTPDGGARSNLTDLGFTSPSIFVDPDSPGSHRYRATGWLDRDGVAAGGRAEQAGYFAAHSSDGLHWMLDSPVPTWSGGDVINSIYHPGQRRGIVALKRIVHVMGIPRRAIWIAELTNGQWSSARSALVPDEFDDVCAMARGFVSGDYYGMGMMPAGRGTVAFIWQFRHSLPRTQESGFGVFGAVDVSLGFQSAWQDRWLHAGGRKDFLSHGGSWWKRGAVYTASCAVDLGKEQRLYFCGWERSHAWYVDDTWAIIEKRKEELIRSGSSRIGFMSWPKDRLFGVRADPEGIVELDLGVVNEPCELRLNYESEPGGSIRVELVNVPGRGLDDAVACTGDSPGTVARWKSGSTIAPHPTSRVCARFHIEKAEIYAFELQKTTSK